MTKCIIIGVIALVLLITGFLCGKPKNDVSPVSKDKLRILGILNSQHGICCGYSALKTAYMLEAEAAREEVFDTLLKEMEAEGLITHDNVEYWQTDKGCNILVKYGKEFLDI